MRWSRDPSSGRHQQTSNITFTFHFHYGKLNKQAQAVQWRRRRLRHLQMIDKWTLSRSVAAAAAAAVLSTYLYLFRCVCVFALLLCFPFRFLPFTVFYYLQPCWCGARWSLLGLQQQQQQQPLQSGGFSFGCSLFSGCFELNTVKKFSSLSLSPVPGCPSCCLLDRYCSSSAAAVVPYFLEWPFSLCFFYLSIYYAVSDTCCRL